ncbi:unnamed protein product [Didymodactylos carnosus]|uniref:Speckle-type POZ protein n=1 Tax=Didymodactylos carnosus TaxID=1234261 RepID=A0A813ZFW7_9BILA|nr:unnamed protein product [Didymodactylos carnosus]CAF0942670.1 unnamed protein product [Didymodactylos carnosus]CAF3680440.1 unnamed protein product [Didymodactylos carnosus]CAF3717574.1 unnamed protein product [Didymodactylos carnosus]
MSAPERSIFRTNKPLSNNPPHSISVTDRRIDAFTHLWTIDHFPSYLDDPQSPRVLFSSYFSPNFGSHTDSVWCLKLYPKGVNEKSLDYVSLFVKYVRGRSDLKAKAEFSIINSKGEFHVTRKTPYHIFPQGGDWGYTEYLLRLVLTNQRKSELLNSDQSLKIFTRVIIVGESYSERIQYEKKNTYENLLSLSLHMGSLLQHNNQQRDNFCDVTIVVRPPNHHQHLQPTPQFLVTEKANDSSKEEACTKRRTKRRRYNTNSGSAGESSCESNQQLSTSLSSSSDYSTTFHAHRSILSVRSPVFAAMFSHSMLEEQNATIEINDLTAETVRALLDYIYTGDVEDIEDNSIDIFKAADKYALELLKQKAELIMMESLSVANCTELYIVADLHNATQLKKKVLDFIMKNILEVTESEDWRTLVENYPNLATEAFVYSATHAASSCACSA